MQVTFTGIVAVETILRDPCAILIPILSKRSETKTKENSKEERKIIQRDSKEEGSLEVGEQQDTREQREEQGGVNRGGLAHHDVRRSEGLALFFHF